MHHTYLSYWQTVWLYFKKQKLGLVALFIVISFCLIGIYAPFLASSKPLVVHYAGTWYFPLFRYLFFPGFYSKYLDLFYNLLMFTLPLYYMSCCLCKKISGLKLFSLFLSVQILIFVWIIIFPQKDPDSDVILNKEKQEILQKKLNVIEKEPLNTVILKSTWQEELKFLTPYAKLNTLLHDQLLKAQHKNLQKYETAYIAAAIKKGKKETALPTLWYFDQQRKTKLKEENHILIHSLKDQYTTSQKALQQFLQNCEKNCQKAWTGLTKAQQAKLLDAKNSIQHYQKAKNEILYLEEKGKWLKNESKKITFEIWPLLSAYHWEDDIGGEQDLNRYVSWWELTRINRKSMVAALIFGIRISLSVGLLAIGLALLIGVPLGAIAGYYGGRIDLLLCRLIEVWESMPTFFMLLMIVAFLQSKSIFLVIGVIGLFGWTNFSRFIRGEFLKQKQLPYVEACHALGFNHARIMFKHLLPNAIPPLLTLVPFAMMSAITSEAGLSFLGLGEEGSASWGVLMDEGRSAFPSESYLLWPPAILLTILLVAIAVVGDALRDALDPKIH